MKSVMLLPLRTADGRLRYASYASEEEKQQILAWAQENRAKVGPEANASPSPLQRLA